MNEIFQRAKDLQKELPREIMAHRLSAEYHRRMDMILGGTSTVLTTLVGTAIFTGLVGNFGFDGKSQPQNPFSSQGMTWLYISIIVLSLSAPILAALHTFMHNAEDAAKHKNSVKGYADVLRQLTGFLAKYSDSEKMTQYNEDARKEYDEIMKAHQSVLGESITLTKKAYEKADDLMKEQTQSKPNNGMQRTRLQHFLSSMFGERR